MSENEQQPEVQLPGYELIEKIGSGGYGEVWSAIAPGGLRKAVKFVFGNQFDKRATSELHALERVKSVRHPFLLSLERIEIVDGRLIVVSELADGSLRDRFRECVLQGLPGVPRDELLGYLSDAADALDYIGSKHDLAHLDIKPENLLLVAGHVKVADFGLVKSLSNQTQASLVGGMTPTYAAPEVFRGTPSRQSDQYSLAVMYQEMLTGVLPFAGLNAAELTLQHMGDDPDLARLAEGDRFAVGRALAKEPDNRYESCSAFISAVKRSADAGAMLDTGGAPSFDPGAPPSPAASEAALNRHSVTEVFEESGAGGRDTPADSIRVLPDALPEPEPQELAAPQVEGEEPFSAAPAVFIGLGGAGARVLRSLRSQINEHLGVEDPLAAAPMLLIDTDPRTLAAATRRDDGVAGLEASETITLPLRRPQQYRDKADLMLRWLGRRWLYNIPRSMQTEGIRPLGRLALVDHARQAFQRIRGVLASANDAASREASRDSAGVSFDRPGVRVYLVGSAAGGSGSGMATDIAYAVRAILDRLGLEGSPILGLITHSTPRDATRAELARVNSYAWLCEFENFRTSPTGYPGDESVGLPGHGPGVSAYDHAYFVPLGDRIDTPEFESAADALAEYLYADAFTPNQRLLDACRGATDGGPGSLRSLAVRHRDGQAGDELSPLERAAAARMIDRWLGGEEANHPDDACKPTDQVVHGAVAFLGRTQLDSSTLASNCRALLEASLGGDASAYIDARFIGGEIRNPGQLAIAIDRCFGVESPGSPPTRVDQRSIGEVVEPITQKLLEEVCRWVLGKVNDSQERLDGASRAVAWLCDHLRAVDADLLKVETNLTNERARVIRDAKAALMSDARSLRTRLFRLRLDQAALIASRSILARLLEQSSALPEELQSLHAVASELSDLYADPEGEDAGSAEAQHLSVAIEKRLQEDYLTANGGLLGALSQPEVAADLPKTIAYAAKRVARDLSGTSRAAADAALQAGFAEPPLREAGGEYYRLTLELPAAAAEGAQETELLLVTEMAGASLPHVAAALTGGRRDYAAFAERVRIRRDIPWVDAVVGAQTQRDEGATPTLSASMEPVATAVLS